MKNLTLLIIVTLFIQITAISQTSCLPEGITFNTQAQIDSFQINYPGCIEIEGDVAINGGDINNLQGLDVLSAIGGELLIFENNNLTSLLGLEGLTSIEADLKIGDNAVLTSLSGLDNLVSVGGGLYIGFTYASGIWYTVGNPSLQNLSGLENLTSIGEDLVILANESLSSLTGLEGLTSISGNLNIGYSPGCDGGNPNLTSLTGLDNVTSIGGYLVIAGNTALTNLTGLNKLTSIGGGLGIHGNYELISLTGLEGLTSINGDLTIGGCAGWSYGGNPNLTSLTGLDNVTSIGGSLGIHCNDALISLTGLEGLTSIGEDLVILANESLSSLTGIDNVGSNTIEDLDISYNISLSTCEVESVCAYLASPNGEITIYDNAVGCNSPEEVLENCHSCLPEGIIFTTQAQIESFQINYPGCSIIEGDVIIQGDDITSLSGLSVLTSIDGDLSIVENDILNSLVGLEGVTSIGGSLWVGSNNYALTNLTGLDNITSIGGDLKIAGLNTGNTYLTSLTGLEGVISVGGDIEIYNNPFLTSLTGLAGLTSIGGDLGIIGNSALNSLAGLENLTSIGGMLQIEGNESMSNLFGLHNIEPGTINDLIIVNNFSLSECDIQNICEYLTSPGANLQIYNNAPGCNSSEEILENCENHCFPEGITFTTQAQIDSFMINYGSCSWIEGDLTINGEDISDLSGLDLITYIDGSVTIGTITGNANPQLTSLSGLNNLVAIGSNLKIYSNQALTSLEGLDNLGSVFGYLNIGDASLNAGNPALSSLSGLEGLNYLGGSLKFSGNGSLTSLTALSGLNVIGGQLRIKDNASLTSLTGLENINAGSISYLQIIYNDLLHECEVQSVCDYLAAPNGNIDIYDNAPGCNSPEEVQEACNAITSIPIFKPVKVFSIFPNPVGPTTIIKYNLSHNSPVSLKIFNISGQKIQTLVNELQNQGEQSVVFNTIGLKPGIYFCTLKTNNNIQTKKIIKF
ncbi:MAG: T9SS type A sorting domain-containing protein [Bacteroidales bacterium]|nr:T9SS type A sorting domain-containing protein [Bacteroidales bacterium]